MNRLEEIENISCDTLGKYAADESVKIPEGFRERLETALISSAVVDKESVRPSRRATMKLPASFALAAAALAAALVLTLYPEREPEETYDNPVLAYAELERTFSYIASKMSKGMEITAEAEETIIQNLDIFN